VQFETVFRSVSPRGECIQSNNLPRVEIALEAH